VDARNRSSCRHAIRIVTAVLAVLAPAVACGPAFADDLPPLRQGMWKFQRTVGGKMVETTKCANPKEDMKKQNAILEKAGCRFSPVRKSGNVYTFTADCSMETSPGSRIHSRSTSVLSVEGDRAYTVEIEVVTDGKSTKETLVAQRVGDCKE
jgi:hypothetical protein